jgi:lipoprotein-anchoring transpeptidase ErfK/SrfK
MRTDRHTRTAPARLAAAATVATIIAVCAVPAPALAFPVAYLDLPGDVLVPPVEPETLRIVINVPARRLFLVEGERMLADYPVAVGRPSTPTPRGSYRILQMAKDPTWAPRGRKIVPPGPANPLGTRWMRVTADGYGIHATNDPGSIGHARSHGCIRMFRADAEAVFAQVQRGTRVDIVYELQGWDDTIGPVNYPDLYALAAETRP